MNYTAEEVRARVNKAWQNHDEQGRVFITMGDAKALVETILPERIKVGEDEDMDAQLTVMIEHLTSIVESQAAEPVAQGEVVDCPECGTRCTHRTIPMSDDVIHEYTPIAAQPHAAQNTSAKPVAQPADSGQVPDGWVLVPREPTTAILEALESTQQNTEAGSLYNSVDCWEAMLEAAIKGKPS